ncbi:MAG: Methyltransferase type 12 [Candidatus Woesebacteria bacterium GW2011_GWA1_39_21b]|uniref:Methyltransferase type 12 n=1 Tax=Candidatus Woesebacteria bacterium GW2011_GWA1_39_21b TaxID=1618551 RepID=A0A0G0RBV3_9BACT|nr:MAG: Methyltransferase type 12 [Microgenomates group bacterium GW2011_GWC1_38_12]KKR11157.1 MAG: Methyltransferase type 12 [Candidatus Woesebacteria bacterium GW2011_GWA1_39_21b]
METLEVMKEARWYNQWLFKMIKPYLGKDILEVGAGTGNFTRLLSKIGKVSVIDIEERYIKYLKKNKNISSGIGDIEEGQYFFRNGLFDSIVCLNVLEHISDDLKALKNSQKLLKEGGTLVLLVPAHKILFSNFDKTLGHFRRYTTGELTHKLKSAGFTVITNRYLNWWAAIGWFVFLRLTGWRKIPKSEVGIFNYLGRLFLWPEKFIKFPFGLSVLVVAKK